MASDQSCGQAKEEHKRGSCFAGICQGQAGRPSWRLSGTPLSSSGWGRVSWPCRDFGCLQASRVLLVHWGHCKTTCFSGIMRIGATPTRALESPLRRLFFLCPLFSLRGFTRPPCLFHLTGSVSLPESARLHSPNQLTKIVDTKRNRLYITVAIVLARFVQCRRAQRSCRAQIQRPGELRLDVRCAIRMPGCLGKPMMLAICKESLISSDSTCLSS